MMRRLSALTLSISLALIAPVALAEPSAADRATARTLAQEGQHALETKNYTMAIDKFSRADSLVHAPTLLLGLARAQVGATKLVEAQENYNRIIREGVATGAPKSWSKAVDDANKEVGAISPRIPWVTIIVLGPSSPEVVIDSTPVPHASLGVKRAINPGTHKVKVSAEGYLPQEKSIALTEGQSLNVNIELEQAPESAPPPEKKAVATTSVDTSASSSGSGEWRRTVAYVAFGVGGASLIVGGVAGGLAIAKNGQLADNCPVHNQCETKYGTNIETYHRLGTISDVGFIVGGVGIAAGVVLLLTQPKDTTAGATRVTPYIGLGNAGVAGVF
ncbi:MAG TPA: PEGA domain-containing protein [Polyangiaceae bacterium]|nr:PEGA domain-containing protein [Polyangiaceae bacterium]